VIITSDDVRHGSARRLSGEAARGRYRGGADHFSETPAQFGIAPELGVDNDHVLAKLGYSAEQIRELRDRKVI
jgi:crotonobetainyl-CoA:carnitine CoA-transferase CaiB-like acyl-CoA transferase